MSKGQVEKNKRAVAGLALTTKGRARMFKDRSKYDRKREKKKDI